MKCPNCNIPLHVKLLYIYYIANYRCSNCGKFGNIHIPEHIPYNQFSLYSSKKYEEIIKKEQKIQELKKKINSYKKS